MSKLNLSINLSTYTDSKASNAPSLSNFKWSRSLSGIAAANPVSQVFTVAPNSTLTLFTGSAVKKLVYLETNSEIDISLNGAAVTKLKPIVVNNSVHPGVFLKTSDITSLVVTNNSLTESATVFLAAVE